MLEPAASGTAKIVPEARPDRVRVEEVRPRIGGHEGVDARAVRAAQDRPEVARLLDPLDDDDERVLGQPDPVEAELRPASHRYDAVGPVAERELRERRLGHRHEPRVVRAEPFDQLLAGGRPASLVADEDGLDSDPGLDGSQQLGRAVDQDQARLVTLASDAKRRGRPDPRVGRARDRLDRRASSAPPGDGTEVRAAGRSSPGWRARRPRCGRGRHRRRRPAPLRGGPGGSPAYGPTG